MKKFQVLKSILDISGNNLHRNTTTSGVRPRGKNCNGNSNLFRLGILTEVELLLTFKFTVKYGEKIQNLPLIIGEIGINQG
jgi:hypothetical protein